MNKEEEILKIKVLELQKTCDIFYKYSYFLIKCLLLFDFSDTDSLLRNNAHQVLMEYFDQNITYEKLIEFTFTLQNSQHPMTLLLTTNSIIFAITKSVLLLDHIYEFY